MPSELSADEIMAIGEKLYLERIQAEVEPKFDGQYIAIDVISGNYVVSTSSIEAVDAVHAAHADAVISLLRVAYTSTEAIGARLQRRDKIRAA